MRTLVVSDLHLGARTNIDLLRRAALREPLLRAVEGADRVVLLGDTLELRHGPAREALEAAGPLLEELGEALGDGQLLLLPGNHDHQLLSQWLEARGRQAPGPPLGLEQRIAPADASALARIVASRLGRPTVELAYPGVWLRDDVWATHGHYLDRHTTVPAYERIGAALVERFVRPLPDPLADPDDYEAILAPIYALLFGAAQSLPPESGAAHSGASVRMWENLSGGRRRLRSRALAAAVPLVVGALNRAGLGPLRPELSGVALRRAALVAMGEVIARLGVQAQCVLFGHTHRAGPFGGEEAGDWSTPSGTRLMNTGSWVYERPFVTDTPNESPYWPGACVVLEDAGPPGLERLLGYRTEADFMPARA